MGSVVVGRLAVVEQLVVVVVAGSDYSTVRSMLPMQLH